MWLGFSGTVKVLSVMSSQKQERPLSTRALEARITAAVARLHGEVSNLETAIAELLLREIQPDLQERRRKRSASPRLGVIEIEFRRSRTGATIL